MWVLDLKIILNIFLYRVNTGNAGFSANTEAMKSKTPSSVLLKPLEEAGACVGIR